MAPGLQSWRETVGFCVRLNDFRTAAVHASEVESMAKKPVRSEADDVAMREAPARRKGRPKVAGMSAAGENAAAGPTEHEIRARAYQMFLERGGRDGADFDDWLRAERELKGRSKDA
jgi:hypothetical protein